MYRRSFRKRKVIITRLALNPLMVELGDWEPCVESRKGAHAPTEDPPLSGLLGTSRNEGDFFPLFFQNHVNCHILHNAHFSLKSHVFFIGIADSSHAYQIHCFHAVQHYKKIGP